jgi:hypothetical protein
MVARTGGYTHDVGGWDLSIVQGQFLSRRAKPDSQLLHRCMGCTYGRHAQRVVHQEEEGHARIHARHLHLDTTHPACQGARTESSPQTGLVGRSCSVTYHEEALAHQRQPRAAVALLVAPTPPLLPELLDELMRKRSRLPKRVDDRRHLQATNDQRWMRFMGGVI